MAKKTSENPIPADLMEMTLAELQNMAYRHDSGDIRAIREGLVLQRDEAQKALEQMSARRHDINRAMNAKMQEELKRKK